MINVAYILKKDKKDKDKIDFDSIKEISPEDIKLAKEKRLKNDKRKKDEILKDNTYGENVSVPAQDGGTVKICSIKAYRELSVAPKSCGGSLYVPERFYYAYRESEMTGLDFCWAKDTGKYAAQQYFEIFGTERIPQVAVAWDLENQDLRKLGADGGWLPRLGEVFARWTQLNLPYCYRKEDMPAGGIAYAYIPRTFSFCRTQIH